MKIKFHRHFKKVYQKLPLKHRTQVDSALKLFQEDPHHPDLYNHALKGNLKGKRSIAAGFDLRIIFEVEGDYVLVIFLALGAHEKVY